MTPVTIDSRPVQHTDVLECRKALPSRGDFTPPAVELVRRPQPATSHLRQERLLGIGHFERRKASETSGSRTVDLSASEDMTCSPPAELDQASPPAKSSWRNRASTALNDPSPSHTLHGPKMVSSYSDKLPGGRWNIDRTPENWRSTSKSSARPVVSLPFVESKFTHRTTIPPVEHTHSIRNEGLLSVPRAFGSSTSYERKVTRHLNQAEVYGTIGLRPPSQVTSQPALFTHLLPHISW
jgi:hypothetical protein